MTLDRVNNWYGRIGYSAGLLLLVLAMLSVVGGVLAAAVAGVLGDTYPALESLILSILKDGANYVITGPVLKWIALSIVAYSLGFGCLLLANVIVSRVQTVRA